MERIVAGFDVASACRNGVRPASGAASLATAALLVLSGCADAPDAAGAAPARPAKLVEVAARDSGVTVTLPAVFEASATAELAFQSAGRVASISVREGDTVQMGDEIARLDQRGIRNDLAAAEARYDVSESEFRRAERLLAEDAISLAVHGQRRTQLEVARTALEAARKLLDDSELRAPFAGIVAFQNVLPQQDAVTLQSDGTAEAIVQAPATLIANSPRIEATDTAVLLDAVPGVAVPGALHSLSARADPTGQTFEARIAFDPPDGVVVRPGMTGAVRSTLSIPGAAAGIAVPLEAVFSEGGAQYVWVVDTDSMEVSRRRVEVGEGVGETLPVLGGLEAGETIVAAGVSFVHEGMIVRRYEP